jgi:ABC-type lipoprotein export system ATPase subunit
VQLTGLWLDDFRRFEHLELSPLDPDLTIVVGPNGSGKSTLLHALRVMNLALGWSASFDSDALNQLEIYASALRQQASSHSFSIRVGLRFTEHWEMALMGAFVRAVLASSVAEHQPSSDPSALNELLSSVTDESLDPLLNGCLAITYVGRTAPSWLVGYEFAHGGKTYYLGIQGAGGVGYILPGRLPDQPIYGIRRVDLASRVEEFAKQGKTFSIDLLLPTDEDGVEAQVKGTIASKSSAIEDFMASIRVTPPGSSRDYSIATVLNRVVKSSLALISDQRLPPRTHYPANELGLRPSLIDGANVPQELFMLKNGNLSERARFDRIKDLFANITGRSVELKVRPTDESGQTMRIEPIVVEGIREVPVSLAGAGAWEALILATVLCGEPGMVAALDEPAVNLSPTLQRRLADVLSARAGTQVLLITHSPYLVPMRTVADLKRIVRVSGGASDGTSTVGRLVDQIEGSSQALGLGAHWRQLLAGRADVRSALFAAGVILVEGEADLGAFDQWFREARGDGNPLPAPDFLNLLILTVGGDGLFGQYVSYLEACGIPWVIVCDGPVLSPKYQGGVPLIDQLRDLGRAAYEGAPNDPQAFDDWKGFWAGHRVFTLATKFGGLTKDSKDKSGEIEAYFESVDAAVWVKENAAYRKSKVRAAHAFASAVACPVEVSELYGQIVRLLRP